MADPGLEPQTGLVYLRARYYDPQTGQFLTRDPLEQLTRQPYSYVNDNPLNGTDPTGLDCGITDPGGCINDAAGAVGGAVGGAATWAWNHPVEAVGVVAGGAALVTGVGAVAAGAGLLGEAAAGAAGTLGSASAVTGVVGAAADVPGCLKALGVISGTGSGVSCVGAITGGIGAGAGVASATGAIDGVVADGATAIGIPTGAIGLLGDLAGTLAEGGPGGGAQPSLCSPVTSAGASYPLGPGL